jgi:hypothetical protein
MSDHAKRHVDAAAKRAADVFGRQQQSERRITDEEKRHSEMLAKIARLRKLRLARDAAEAEAAKGETKRKGGGPSK